jgi:hypothetical protein
MANTILKPTVIVNTAVALLRRQVLLPAMFWRDGLTDFTGAAGDTITLRLPAYGVAKTRALRSAGPIVLSELHERGVDVSLDTDVYHAVATTDEELTLDITDFAGQVLSPQTEAVARGLEDIAADTMTGATYAKSIVLDPTNPRAALVQAKTALDLANVPAGDRFFAMGSNVEAAFLSDPTLTQVNTSGSASVLRDAELGRLYGFTLVSAPVLPADSAFAFHRTAFALASRAPVVPAGASYGASTSAGGFAMRHIRDYDAMNLRDRSIINSYIGTAAVTDNGAFNGEGRFVPDEQADGTDLLVRAVEVTLETSP